MNQVSVAPAEHAVLVDARRIRVLYISDAYYLGADTRCELSLLEHLDHDRFQIVVVTLPDGPTARAARCLTGAEHIPIDLGTINSPVTSSIGKSIRSSATFTAGLAHVGHIACRVRPDVIITGDRTRSMLAAMAAARLSRAPLVYHPGSSYSPTFKNARWKHMTASHADLVLANSNFTRETYLQLGIATNRVITAYNGLDASYFAPGSGYEVRERYGISHDALLVGMFSLLRPFKGHNLLLKAMARVVAALPRAHLLLLGDGPEQAELSSLAWELGITQHVTFAGFQRDTPPFYRALDLYVMPSDEESFGMVTIEAMACEKAVVGMASGGTAEIVVDRSTGLLVPTRRVEPLADAIIELLRDSARRLEMGQRGRQRVLDQFTIEGRARQAAPLLAKVAEVRFKAS